MNSDAKEGALVRSRMRSLFCLALVCLSVSGSSKAQDPAKPPLPELWATLQAKFDSDKIKAGDELTAQVMQSWVYGTCGVNEGTVLRGKIAAIEPWTDNSKAIKIAVSFEAQCLDHSKRVLMLMAVFYPAEKERSQMDTYMAMPQGIGAGASGRQSTNLESMPSPGPGPAQNLPLAKMGEVQRIRHFSLDVGKGQHGSTNLVSSDKRLRLDAGTRLVFVPVPEAD